MELRAPSHLDKGGAQSRADFGGVISADIDLIRAHFIAFKEGARGAAIEYTSRFEFYLQSTIFTCYTRADSNQTTPLIIYKGAVLAFNSALIVKDFASSLNRADIDLIRAHFKPRFDLGLLVNSWVLEIPRKEGSGILLSAQFHLMQLQDSRERESAARV